MINIKNLGRGGGEVASEKVWAKRKDIACMKNLDRGGGEAASEKVWVKKGGYRDLSQFF